MSASKRRVRPLSAVIRVALRVAYIALPFAAAGTVRWTALEDRTLRAELPGYAEYARDVRWKLLPGVW